MDLKIVAGILARLLTGLTAILLFPFLLSLQQGESCWWIYVLTMLATGAVATLLNGWGHIEEKRLSVREGIAITGLGWLFTCSLGMLPYVLGGWLGPLDGFVETTSGFSGTGATVINSLKALPESILLWRMLTHWFGGLGIVVIFIALLPHFGHGAIYMYDAESTGPTENDRFLPRVKEMARVLFCIYAGLTGMAAAAYLACGMAPLEAVEHAMSTIATGGFSTHDESIAYFDNPVLEMVIACFMLIASVNFGLYAGILSQGKKGWWKLYQNSEVRLFFAGILLAVTVITINLVFVSGMDWTTALRGSIFSVASMGSTTGFVTADFDTWPTLSKLMIMMVFFAGGCAGSTSGGLKVTRVLMLWRMVKAFLQTRLHDRARLSIKINGQSVANDVLMGVGRYFFLYLCFVFVFSLILVFDGSQIFDAFTVCMSVMSSAGPAFGSWGPTCNYAAMPPLSKITVTIAMLLGRLEIFTFLVMLRPSFWRKNKY